MAGAPKTPNVHYRIGSIAGFFIVATAVFFDAVGFLLTLTGIGAIGTEIMGITGAIMFFIWFMFHHVNYLSGRSLQKLGVMGVGALVEAIPFLNGISPTFVIQTVLLIRITRKEDREEAQRKHAAQMAAYAQEQERQQFRFQQYMKVQAMQAADNDDVNQ